MHLPEKLSLPCQPRVVALLMNELRSTNPSLRRLNQLFGSDPVLAAWLLEQANAGIYQLSGMVQTIPQAVALLGVAQLRNLQKRALGHIAQRIPGLEQLGPFSCDCARLARSFASALSLDGGLAYTAGLLHGLGQIVFLQTQPQVQAVTKMESWAMGPWDPLRAQWERKHFGYTATQACAKLLAQWGIPAPVTQLIDALEQVSFRVGKQKFDLWMLIHGTVTIGVTLLVALWVASLLESRLMAADRMDANLREVMARLAKAVLTVVALLCSLSLVGIDVTALSVFSGAFAVGLGFGLQKIASNYVSGFIILLDRSIRLGNLVAVDTATSGTVSQITTRYTVLKTLTGTEVIIPNEYLVSNIVRNLSFSDTRVRVAVTVQVAYQTDLDQAMQIMVEAARRQERVLSDPEPAVLLTDFAESGINLELGFWVSDPEAGTGGVRSNINMAIWKAFRDNGIEIPYPQREIRVIGAPAMA